MTTSITKTPAFKKLVNDYILNAIEGEGYKKEFNTDKERLQFLADCYKSEYSFPDNLRRYGSHQKCFENWIMGLPSSFSIDFENYRIIEIAKEWQSIPVNANERQQDKIIENWFNFIAAKTIQLMIKNGVSIN